MSARPIPDYQTGNEVRIQSEAVRQNGNTQHTQKQRAASLFQYAGARIIGTECSNSNTRIVKSDLSKILDQSTMKCLTSALIRKDL